MFSAGLNSLASAVSVNWKVSVQLLQYFVEVTLVLQKHGVNDQ